MKIKTDFWTYFDALLDASPVQFHDVHGVRIFPVYADEGNLSLQSAVIVMHETANGYKVPQIDRKSVV